ncbi:NADP dehydrogenase [ubiquinone] 1 beta subcomplex subunit 4 [Plakobranchus ocellatus]|uniref:NADH dehydrogenase [ubiquinone] 1 beta subcomplex subunit 4 n=1 Tax=Plakobranchus ocellatus TaxID=259542 RepID=A0AAV4DXQ5_9GAST|nr:NADP dehydrogenase [ubiquinone] 1 beta subcomplex subunit 4 [Plakobranchus ocellatus]
MSQGNQRLWDPWKMYDAKPEELRAMKERAKMREALKAEWTKKYTNPYKSSHPGGFLHDPAVQRFMSLKATQVEHFKGTFRSAVIAFCLFAVPVGLLTWGTIRNRDYKENLYRNGKVMYKDRPDRFCY